MTEIIRRDMEMRLDNESGLISGIAVPYNEVINVGGYKERFERGAIDSIDDAKLFYGHEEPIGKITHGEDRDEGFYIEAKISDTERGREVLTLLRDGVLNKFSVGFNAVEDRQEEGVIVRTKVRLRETSVVPFPAYENATVLSVREADQENNLKENNNMNEEINDEIRSLSEEMAEIKRNLDTFRTAPVADPKPAFRSVGEYAKGLVHGDEKAIELFQRADAVTTDTVVKDAWIGDLSRIIDRGRPTVSAFSSQALPASGLNVEYAQVKTNTIATAEQANELDDLQYGELSLETETAAVKTFGGYVSMSRQTIERSSVNYLDTAFRAMAVGYAKKMNSVLVAAIEAADYTTDTVDVLDPTDGALWINAIANAAVKIDANQGFGLDFLLVSPDMFVELVSVVDNDGRAQVAAGNPSNNIGSANVAGLSVSILGVPVVIDPALTAGSAYAASKQAWVTLESPGAPVRLQDENIVNLSKQFSVYGYAAWTNPFPGSIIKIESEIVTG